jgi:hypothetical protein
MSARCVRHHYGMNDDRYAQWLRDAELLGDIGRELFSQNLTLTVRLPHALAARARLAWERDESEPLPPQETPDQRLVRNQAGTLALIGLAAGEPSEDGENGQVLLRIDAWQVGGALDAADSQGKLTDVQPPSQA